MEGVEEEMEISTSTYTIKLHKKNELVITDKLGNIVLHLVSEKFKSYRIKDDIIYIMMLDKYDEYSGQVYYDIYKFTNNEMIFSEKVRW